MPEQSTFDAEFSEVPEQLWQSLAVPEPKATAVLLLPPVHVVTMAVQLLLVALLSAVPVQLRQLSAEPEPMATAELSEPAVHVVN